MKYLILITLIVFSCKDNAITGTTDNGSPNPTEKVNAEPEAFDPTNTAEIVECFKAANDWSEQNDCMKLHVGAVHNEQAYDYCVLAYDIATCYEMYYVGTASEPEPVDVPEYAIIYEACSDSVNAIVGQTPEEKIANHDVCYYPMKEAQYEAEKVEILDPDVFESEGSIIIEPVYGYSDCIEMATSPQDIMDCAPDAVKRELTGNSNEPIWIDPIPLSDTLELINL